MFLLSSCSCTSGPSFFSISLTASVAAIESSFASREVSRMRWNSVGQLRADGANRVELAFQRADVLDRLDDFRGRGLELDAQIFERALLLAQRFDGRLVLERLRRQLIDREAMLLQLAVRAR